MNRGRHGFNGNIRQRFLIGFSGNDARAAFRVAIDGSLKRLTAGPAVVLGHGILEFILLFFMTFGLMIFARPTVAGFIGLFGGAYLAWMGTDIKPDKKTVSLENAGSQNGAGGRTWFGPE